MTSFYLIPAGTPILVSDGGEPTQHVTKRDLAFNESPDFTETDAIFERKGWRIVVPRDAVVVSKTTTGIDWNEFGV